LPGRPGRWLAASVGANWPRARWLPRPLRLGRVIENLARDPAAAYFIDLCFLKPWDAQALMGSATEDPRDSAVYDTVTSAYRSCPSASDLQRAQYADLKIYLPNDPLVKVDRMSMAHGLEIRSPLLDRRVVEFAFRIPTERKFSLFRSKPLLRSLASRRLPADVVHLPKRGFTSPIGTWLAGPYAQRFEDDVLGPGSIVRDLVDVTLVRRLAGEHRVGAADHSYALWALWMLERWHATVHRQSPVHTGAASVVRRSPEFVKETL
jgi:asparagine synthase (glutamine-hydrolysing)